VKFAAAGDAQDGPGVRVEGDKVFGSGQATDTGSGGDGEQPSIDNGDELSSPPSQSRLIRNATTGAMQSPWEPNDCRSGCAICDCKFGVMKRKHHCRACGTLVCDPCLSLCLPSALTLRHRYATPVQKAESLSLLGGSHSDAVTTASCNADCNAVPYSISSSLK
jgi:hypothetical protein